MERDVNQEEALTEMLAFVLAAVGHPVIITKEMMRHGLPNGAEISIDEDIERDCFVFSLKVSDEQS